MLKRTITITTGLAIVEIDPYKRAEPIPTHWPNRWGPAMKPEWQERLDRHRAMDSILRQMGTLKQWLHHLTPPR